MGAYKQFLASDIIVTPFEVNKGFTFHWDVDPTLSNSLIDRFLGKNITSSLFNPLSDPTTGTLSTQYQRLVYSSIKELYYSNYVSSSYGDNVNRPILIPGKDTEGNRLVGSTDNPSYDNYLQTTLSYPKIFPTASDAIIGVISIPGRLFGDYIQPKSFKYTSESGSLTDDGEGNIWLSTPLTPQSILVGNIYYPHGLITIIGNGNSYSGSAGTQYGTVFYGTGIYGGAGFGSMEETILNFITTTSATCSFSSSYTIQETQYKCTIRENEYGFTLNPSVISSSADGTLYGFITESYFSPYISTIGLYDEALNLLAIGKLAQPLPSSPTTDTTILINIDR